MHVPGLLRDSSCVLGVVAVLLLGGCGVDERGLRGLAIDFDLGGAGGRGDEGYGAKGDDGEGGASSDPALAVHRWSFDSDVQGWRAESGVEQRWNAQDVSHDPHSGCLSVANAAAHDDDEFWTLAASQCLIVAAEQPYRLSFAGYIPLGQTTGGAGVGLEFTNAPDCQGLVTDGVTYQLTQPGTWQRSDDVRPAPAGAKSALLRLLVSKIGKNPSYEARFDDVRFEPASD